jgi:hypothetical protein
MKKPAILFLAVAIFASATSAYAERRSRPAEPPNPQIVAILNQNPNGGVGLTTALDAFFSEETREDHARRNAAALVALAKNANPDQKAAIARALVDVLARIDVSKPDVARGIRAGLAGLDPVTFAIFNALQTQYYAESRGGRGGHDGGHSHPGGGGFAGGGGGGSGHPVSPH